MNALFPMAAWGSKLLVLLILSFSLLVTPANAQESEPVAQPTNIFVDLNQTLEGVLHTINEIGYFVLDFAKLIKEDPLNGLLELFKFLGQLFGLVDSGDGIDGALPIPGPGLANLDYPQEDLFQPIGWINLDNGLPGIFPGRKPFGTNLGMMIDGYFFTLFAPDSGQGPGGFLFYDVSDPYSPKLVRRIYEADTRTAALKEPHAFGMARINGRRYMVFQSTIGVEFWDFTDLNDLQRVGEIDLPGVTGGDYSNVAWQLTWQAPYVYIASSEQGIFIVDAADPSNPVLADRGGEPNPIPVSELGGFRVGPIFTFGNQLIISSMENRDGFASLDISDPVNPIIMDRIPDLDQFYYASCFNGEHMAVSVRGASARMVLYDLNDPGEFKLTDEQLAVPGQLYCAFQDHYVFQGTEDRVHKIDISDPFNPVDVGSGTISGPLIRLVDHGQVSPLGNLVFIGNDHGTGSAFMPHDLNADNTPPEVILTAPRNGAESVAVSTGIGISFTDVLNFNTVSAESIRITDNTGALLEGVYSLQNGIVNFMPSAPLAPFTEYRIDVLENAVADVMGNTNQSAYSATFTTGAGDRYLDVDVVLSDLTTGADQVGASSDFNAEIAEPLPGATYEWSFGDGTGSGLLDSPQVDHEYSEPGHYQVSLTIRWEGLIRQETFIKTVVPELTENPAISTSTLAQNASTVFVVNPDNESVTAIDKSTNQVIWETVVGKEPQTIALSEQYLWVTVRGDDRVTLLNFAGEIVNELALPYGSAPFGVIYSEARQAAFVSLSGSGKLIEINELGEQLNSADVEDPRAISLSGNGDELFVSRLVSQDAGAEVYRFSLIAGLEALEAVVIAPDETTEDSQDRARGLANYLFDLAVSPSGQEVIVTAKKDNIFRGEFKDGQTLEHDRTVRAVTHRIDVANQDIIEWDFDNRSNPRAVVYSPLGDYIFVAMQGSNKIAVMDAFNGSQRVEFETSLAPQGLMIDEASGYLYAHNFMSRSVQVFDISGILDSSDFSIKELVEVTTVANESLADDVLLGKQVFYNADDPRMSRESYFSCASCHVDGGQDGRTWDFTERGEGLRNTITLEGRSGMGHGNVHWTANFDEIQDFENDIRGGFGGTGFLTDEDFANTSNPLGNPKAGLSEELDALSAYVASLTSVAKSPYKNDDGSLTNAAEQGRAIFNELDCATCHAGNQYTDGQRHVLSTIGLGSGLGMGQPLDQVGIETPTLIGLWNTAPYFHRGQAATLEEVIEHPGHGNGQDLSIEDRTNLVTYLQSLDGRADVQPTKAKGYKLENARWGCLDVANDQLVLSECEATETRWWMDDLGRIQLADQPNLCVEHNGKALYWGRVYVAECSDSPRQQFGLTDQNQIQVTTAKLFNLDAFGSQPGSKVGLWWRHSGDNQQWLIH